MELTRALEGEVLLMAVRGRLDGYWADHLDQAIGEAVHAGHHRLRLDCTGVSFLSSASIGVLVKHYQQLAKIGGTFQVVNPSLPVASVLRVTRLTDLLIDGSSPPAAPSGVSAQQPAPRHLEKDGVVFEVYPETAAAPLSIEAIGSPAPLASGRFTTDDCRSLEGRAPVVAVGLGAFGADFADCESRFGELLSVAGATVYQPADGMNVADYLLAGSSLGSDVRLLYGLSCEGRLSHHMRFDAGGSVSGLALASLLSQCLDELGAGRMAIVIVAETSGLAGAALRKSPARHDGTDFFSFPTVRMRLSFTTERMFPDGVALIGGIVCRGSGAVRADEAPQLRPFGELSAHLHAAAFGFRPVRKGRIDLAETVNGLFEPGRLAGVVHLLHDDRGAAGAGDSRLIRGACWFGGIA